MSRLLTFSFLIFSILSIFIGFTLNEDLSSGGSEYDFYLTLEAVKNLSNFSFTDYSIYTRHFPLHYILLSIPYGLFENDLTLRLIYLSFSLLLPVLLYLNLNYLIESKKINILLISSAFLFFPFYRSSSMWANSHLTAVIFFLSANLFFLKGKKGKNIYKYLNLFFLSLSTYSVQSYVIFYIFYLFYYFKNSNLKDFINIFLFCILLSLPGFFFILSSEGERSVIGLAFSKNIFYSLITNFSIIFFYYCFFIFNNKNFKQLKKSLYETKKLELFFLILFFLLNVYFYHKDDSYLMLGGGFFYKISLYLTQNNLIFFLSSFLGMLISMLIIKKENNFLFIIVIINIMSSHYLIYQKYFEPIFILMIFVLSKNFLTKNIINSKKNTLIFISLIFGYYLVTLINSLSGISKSLITS